MQLLWLYSKMSIEHSEMFFLQYIEIYYMFQGKLAHAC
jgi:hypothetical protein